MTSDWKKMNKNNNIIKKTSLNSIINIFFYFNFFFFIYLLFLDICPYKINSVFTARCTYKHLITDSIFLLLFPIYPVVFSTFIFITFLYHYQRGSTSERERKKNKNTFMGTVYQSIYFPHNFRFIKYVNKSIFF